MTALMLPALATFGSYFGLYGTVKTERFLSNLWPENLVKMCLLDRMQGAASRLFFLVRNFETRLPFQLLFRLTEECGCLSVVPKITHSLLQTWVKTFVS